MDYNTATFTVTSHHNPNNYNFNGKIMLSLVIIMFIVVLILVWFRSYARRYFHRRHGHTGHHHFFLSSTTNFTNNNHIGALPNQALDLSTLKKIPTFVYASNTHKHQPECAVCLSEFEDEEKGRVLPMCNHSFHVDCIDMWFHSHSNCPLCRTPVQLDNPVPPSAQSVEEMVSVTEPAGSVTAGEEGETGCSSSTLPHLELVGVLVDMPKVDSGGLDDMGLDAPEETGFKSSGNRG
ncbi:RING-H2 finger protein ATL64-like [Pistacia vera]|uniref:RING-H2 finger protein ATL64-like n=1 Tax=Pistacia vera TaxID=55513 RepID=UPI0012633087|nr:RING-H2 finger protein ATL64-like [Pistacia vera]